MPTYDFKCPNGHEFDRFYRKISDALSEVACPTCGLPAARQMSAGAGLLFKGSGFYITDYGKDGKKKPGAPASTDGGTTPSSGDSGGASTTDGSTKSAAGGDATGANSGGSAKDASSSTGGSKKGGEKPSTSKPKGGSSNSE